MPEVSPRDELSQPERPNDKVGRGIAIALLCQFGYLVIAGIVCSFKQSFLFAFLVSWGIAPLTLLAPLYVINLRKRNLQTAKGILIIGSIGFLLNATCDTLVTVILRPIF